jgi:2-oxoglutarate ferredoxin oxidoreductase subunit beta
MEIKELGTYAKNTWCPGCGNFAILNSVKAILKDLSDEGLPTENIVLVSGIGCHAKLVDYINVNSFYSIHGRVTPVAEGIKLANPGLKVIGFAGDGDAYGEGIEHLIFAAKRNVDITMIIHNNRVYGLTTGQYTPTSPMGYRGRSTPKGTLELPINPLEIMLASGASFIARGYSRGLDFLKTILKEAIIHKGFSLVDVLQVCVTFYDMYEYYNKRVYELNGHTHGDFSAALNKIREWNYQDDAPIGLGIFYKKEMPTFEDRLISSEREKIDINSSINRVLERAA